MHSKKPGSSPNGADELKEAGKFIFGTRWKSALAGYRARAETVGKT